MMKEVEGYSDYFIDEAGNVFSKKIHDRQNPLGELRLLRATQDRYLCVTLCNKPVYKKKTIHRLVAEAFIPNPDNKPQINHINGIKTDNRVENLEWVTSQENVQHAHSLGLTKPNNKAAKARAAIVLAKPVLQLDLQGNVIAKFKSQSEAKRMTGISNCTISEVCLGKRKTAGGYKWRMKI